MNFLPTRRPDLVVREARRSAGSTTVDRHVYDAGVIGDRRFGVGNWIEGEGLQGAAKGARPIPCLTWRGTSSRAGAAPTKGSSCAGSCASVLSAHPAGPWVDVRFAAQLPAVRRHVTRAALLAKRYAAPRDSTSDATPPGASVRGHNRAGAARIREVAVPTELSGLSPHHRGIGSAPAAGSR